MKLDVLDNYSEVVRNFKVSVFKEKEIILTKEEKEIIKKELEAYFTNNKEVIIKYYDKNYYHFHFGLIKKLGNTLVFKDKFKINISQIKEII